MMAIPTHIRSVVDDDGAVLLDEIHNRISSLNPTGAYIWQAIRRGVEPQRIVSQLVSETGAEPATVASDVEKFIGELQALQLISM